MDCSLLSEYYHSYVRSNLSTHARLIPHLGKTAFVVLNIKESNVAGNKSQNIGERNSHTSPFEAHR